MINNAPLVPDYDPLEERLNFLSHGAGAALALIAGIFLIIKGAYLPAGQWFGLWVYALSMVLLFSASALYHMAVTADRRYFYKKLDHTAIYYLIAGTYTPITLVSLHGPWGWTLFGVIWGLATLGI